MQPTPSARRATRSDAYALPGVGHTISADGVALGEQAGAHARRFVARLIHAHRLKSGAKVIDRLAVNCS